MTKPPRLTYDLPVTVEASRPFQGRSIKMSDIARLAGVSPSTVSRALAGNPAIPSATREAIETIAAEHGYVINRSARNLRQSQTQTIGIAVPLGHEREQLISDPFFLRLFGDVADEISKRGYDILLMREPSPDPQWLTRLVRSQRADGFIIVGQSDQHEALNLAARSFPTMVVFGSQLPGQEYCSVGSDNFNGGRLAAEHLVRSGRRKIMFLGPWELPQVDMRLAGYREVLAQHGLVDDRLICSAHFVGDSARETVDQAIRNGLDFDAVFAASDGIAASAISALKKAGLRCPEDVAIVGFDDTETALHSSPQLTTVAQDFVGIARTLVERLFIKLERQQTESATLPVTLKIRASAP